MKNNQLLQVLGNKSFLFLWLAEIFSQTAANMVNFILLVLAYDLSSSNTAVSAVVLSFTIPSILFGVFAGALVDKSNKKKVLLLTNFFRAILLLFLAFLHTNLVILYVLSFLIALVTQFFIPAESPMVPLLVEKDKLLGANALFGMGIYASILLGYMLSGAFLILFGDTYVFIILAFFFLIAAFFVSFIRGVWQKTDKTLDAENSQRSLSKEELMKAFRIITKSKQISESLFLLSLAQILILILAAIGPGFAKQILEIEVKQFSLYFITPAAIGMVIGALLVGGIFHKTSRRTLTTVGIFVSSASIFFLPLSSKVASKPVVATINAYLPHLLSISILHIVIVIAFLLGIANALVFVPSNTTLQEATERDIRGKIYGLLNSLIGVFSLLPILLAGGLADLIGVSGVLFGISILLFSIFFLRIIFR